MKEKVRNRKEDWRQIIELIDASLELAQKKGPHPLENGCNCIACINKRKDLIEPKKENWVYEI